MVSIWIEAMEGENGNGWIIARWKRRFSTISI
jgi:hypothetical protein